LILTLLLLQQLLQHYHLWEACTSCDLQVLRNPAVVSVDVLLISKRASFNVTNTPAARRQIDIDQVMT
jgi:hypothetical protein